MFCANCGTQVADGTAFCPNCGKAPGQGATPPPPQQQGYAPPPPPISAAGLEENVASALCYLVGFITGIIFLVLEPYKNNKTIRFHAFQSIFFNIVWFAIHWGLGMFHAFMPYGMWALWGMLLSLISLAFFLLWLFLMYKAYNRQMFKLPVIGDLAAKQA